MTNFVLDKQQFVAFQLAFKRLAHEKSLAAADFILYNLVRSKDPQYGFTKISNDRKLNAGMSEWFGYNTGREHLRWTFGYNRKRLLERYFPDGDGEKILSDVTLNIFAKQV